jgi:hypothetical protein
MKEITTELEPDPSNNLFLIRAKKRAAGGITA